MEQVVIEDKPPLATRSYMFDMCCIWNFLLVIRNWFYGATLNFHTLSKGYIGGEASPHGRVLSVFQYIME
jgi:hypothetical protein